MRQWHHHLTHLHIHIDWSRNVSWKFAKTSKCHNFLIFEPIFIRFSLLCLKMFTLSSEIIKLNLLWSSSLSSHARIIHASSAIHHTRSLSHYTFLHTYKVQVVHAWHFYTSLSISNQLTLSLSAQPNKTTNHVWYWYYDSDTDSDSMILSLIMLIPVLNRFSLVLLIFLENISMEYNIKILLRA